MPKHCSFITLLCIKLAELTLLTEQAFFMQNNVYDDQLSPLLLIACHQLVTRLELCLNQSRGCSSTVFFIHTVQKCPVKITKNVLVFTKLLTLITAKATYLTVTSYDCNQVKASHLEFVSAEKGQVPFVYLWPVTEGEVGPCHGRSSCPLVLHSPSFIQALMFFQNSLPALITTINLSRQPIQTKLIGHIEITNLSQSNYSLTLK